MRYIAGMDILDRDVLSTGAGMALLVAGRKMTGLGFFARGILNLEKRWWEQHPEVPKQLGARWQAATKLYEETHQNKTNRRLHRIGIPMIVGGAIGLIVARPYRPLWALSATTFTAGWVLNFVGHYYEGKSPAFAADPLSFIAGPVWDWQQDKKAKTEPSLTTAAMAAN